MKTLSLILQAAPAALLTTSCLQLPPLGETGCRHTSCEHGPTDPADAEPDPWARASDEPTVLYARDGSPVPEASSLGSAPVTPGPDTARSGSAAPLGSSASPAAPNARDVEREDGRLYLLELYQNAVDERDELMAEVARQESIILDMRSLQETLETEFAEMQSRLQELEREKLTAEEQSYELAGRLTTAQIGRLQAELRQLRGEALGGAVEYPLRDGAELDAGGGSAATRLPGESGLPAERWGVDTEAPLEVPVDTADGLSRPRPATGEEGSD